MNNYENLQKVLKEIFEMDKADLDFGIYRIMNQKRNQVMDFVDRQLPKDIKSTLALTQSKDSIVLEAELEQMGKALDAAEVMRESVPKYLSLQQQIANSIDTNALEQEVFSHLANFFKRYYKDGDFISLRRYKKDVYAIPYEGEEVKLHWANADQYYIKTSEYLKNYTFKLKDGKTVHFQLKEASTEQNNNKAQGDQERRFAIYEELPIEVLHHDLYINFTYEAHKKTVKQDDLAKQALEIIQENIPADFASAFDKAPTEKNKNRTLIEKHVSGFISRNSFDYFIHKDLGGFLKRELDFYIKNEVLYLDDINTENPIYFTAQLSKIKALKTVATKIITFLAQIEDFQKKLWLKKKFVINTNYCITVGRIPKKYYAEIIDNKAQLDEWKSLFDVTLSGVEALSQDQFLVLDTKHFSEEFKDKLLAEFDNLDEDTNGLLINSENFQALNVMKEKYEAKVKAIYIDPPYNTGSDGFTYKDGFSHSSWLSMVENRISSSLNVMREDGVFYSSIDDNEKNNLEFLLNNTLGSENQVGNITVVNNFKGRSDTKHIATAHEYLLMYQKDDFTTFGVTLPANYEKEYKLNDDLGAYRLQGLRKRGTNSRREDRPNMFYSIYIDLNNKKISLEKKNEEDVEVLPKLSDGSDGRWRWGKETFFERTNELTYQLVSGRNEYDIFQKDYLTSNGETKRIKPKSIWQGPEFSSEAGTLQLKNILGTKEFSTPKSTGLLEYCIQQSTNYFYGGTILDYFAGSGTTGHATIKLNREDGGNRKYILVEMGTYFNTVTKPRIQKVIYSDNWKNGKPQDKAGISQVFKYQVLESYEDALNNLKLPNKSNEALLQFGEEAQEEYLLRYMLDVETEDHLFSIQMFRDPFNYQLKVTEHNELVPKKVDLVETFNYLIGMYVDRIQRIKDIKLVEGKTRSGAKTLIIWRNLDTTTNQEVATVFRKLYDGLRSSEFDQIYINGDHHFENIRTGGDTFKVKLIEETFFKQMFNISQL